jgi:hypothetical protein
MAACSWRECIIAVLRPYGILYLVRRWFSEILSTKRRYMIVSRIGRVKKITIDMVNVMIPPRITVSTIAAAMLVQLSNPQSWAVRRAAVNE